MSTLQTRVEMLMIKYNLNPTSVAKKIDVNHTTILRILSGSIPKSDTLYKLSILLNVSMEYLLVGVDSHINTCANAHIDCTESDTSSFVKKFSSLSADDKEEIIAIMDLKIKKIDNKKENENESPSFNLESRKNFSDIA